MAVDEKRDTKSGGGGPSGMAVERKLMVELESCLHVLLGRKMPRHILPMAAVLTADR